MHDVDGRLAAVIDLLKSKPAAFDEICWEPQLTSEVGGYLMVVPKALRMFLVYAKRRGQRAVESLNHDNGSATKLPAAVGDNCTRNSGVDGEERKESEVDAFVDTLPQRFCSCVSA